MPSIGELIDIGDPNSREINDDISSNRGRIALGAWADVVVFDRELALTATYVEGEAIVEYA